jgi:hypothetical protein
MDSSRSWRRVASTVAASSLLFLVSTSTVTATAAVPVDLPPALSPTAAGTALGKLTVAANRPMKGYSRDRFPHWAAQGDSCDTRETVLLRDGEDVKQDEKCRAISGTWHSVYDDKIFTSASGLDIDHMVPLAAAWRSGADTWTDARRKKFANDLDAPQLVAVSAASNRSKGDQTPDLWKPPLRSYWCTYSRAWVDVKARYGLTVTEDEHDALIEMLSTCDPAQKESP